MKRIGSFLLSVAFIFTSVFMSFAHSGGTDASGGHRDNKNKSGLGSYHYHHGYGPHLHSNGVCPYMQNTTGSNNSSSVKSGSNATSTSSASQASSAKKQQVVVIAEKTSFYEKASTNSDKLATAKEGYSFTPTGDTKSFWKLEFKKKNDDTIYTGYILKADTKEK